MAPFPVTKFLKDQFLTLPNVETMNLQGRNVIITGSNTGLGLEAARHFAAMNPDKLVIAVRSVDKGEEAKRDIQSTWPAAKIEVWKLDLSSSASVQAFAEKVKSQFKRLDLLCLNAGIAIENWNTTSEGYEATLQTNVISTGLLALLLLPLLEETAKMPVPSGSPSLKPHCTLTGSEVHHWTKFKEGADAHPIHALNDKTRHNASDRYNVSKLLNLYLAREIGAIASDKVIVNVVNPGFCHSSLLRDANIIVHYVTTLMKACIARTTEAGSRNIVWAATHDTAPGAYSSSCGVEEESDYSLSVEGKEAQKKSWDDLKEIWIKIAPETRSILA